MPPKHLTQARPQAEIKSGQTVDGCIPAFTKRLSTVHKLTETPNISADILEKAFKGLTPYRDAVIKVVKQSNKPQNQRLFNAAQKTGIVKLKAGIALSFYLEKNFDLARLYYKDAGKADVFLQPWLGLATLELEANKPSALKETRELLLAAAIQPKHAEEVLQSLPSLQKHAQGLLESYLTLPQGEVDFKDFFKRHSQVLGDKSYLTMMMHYQGNPELLAYWRNELLEATQEHQTKLSTDILQSFYNEQANYYLDQNQITKCYAFVKANMEQFPLKLLAAYAQIFFSKIEKEPKIDLLTLRDWFLQAAETDPQESTTFYLECLAKNTKFYHPTKTKPILEQACANPELAGIANYINGMLHSSLFGLLRDDKQAVSYYHKARTFNSVDACEHLAIHYSAGLGVKMNNTIAFDLYEEAHQTGSIIAALHWAELLISKITSFSPLERQQRLQKALSLLGNLADKPLPLKAYQAYLTGACMFYRDSDNLKATSTNPDDPGFRVITFYADSINPEMIESLQYAIAHGQKNIKRKAHNLLGNCYFSGFGVPEDFEKALHHYQELLSLTEDNFSHFFEYSVYIKCGVSLQVLCEKETLAANKKILEIKALNYFLLAMNLHGDKLPPLANSFMEAVYQNLTNPSSLIKPEICLEQLSTQLREFSEPSWQEQLGRLKTMLTAPLSLPKDSDMVGKIGQCLRTIDEHIFDEPQLFVPLEAYTAACVSEAANKVDFITSLFENVSKWQLASATKALGPLFMHLYPKLPTLSLGELCVVIKWIAQCNFTTEMQENYVLPLVQISQSNVINKALAEKSVTIADASRLFYALALLDCNMAHPTYLRLAEEVFKASQAMVKWAGPMDISQLFHAYHYFSLNYPLANRWLKCADLERYFEIYRATLSINTNIVSKTQAHIYDLLKQLYPLQVKQEVYIDLVGRKVDFLVFGKIIIQYNGSKGHYVWDDEGHIARESLKEKLCYATLTAEEPRKHYKVVRIHRETWANLTTDEERFEYLSRRINQALQEIKAHEGAGERKVAELEEVLIHTSQLSSPLSEPRPLGSGTVSL